MITDKKEIEELISLFNVEWDPFGSGLAEKEWFIEFISKRPYLLFQFGFDQAIIIEKSDNAIKDLAKKYDLYESNVFTPTIGYRTLFRNCKTKEWQLLSSRPSNKERSVYSPSTHLLFYSENSSDEQELSIEYVISSLRNFPPTKITNESNLILIPDNSIITDVSTIESPITIASTELLKSLYKSRLNLANINWTELEDIVAEIFRDKGFQIIKNKRTRDGGRDLIVNGEFFPGIKSKMAVEVTSQKVVGIKKVAQTLYQNRNYPLIMIATSGSFSGGVIKTSREPDNELRLILKDGHSINEWINDYGKENKL
jgi:HJR/Mrr/RecB family endonuclease